MKGLPPLSRDHQVEKDIRGRGCGGERSSAEAFLGHFRIFISVIKQYDQNQFGEEKAYFILKACSTSSWKVKTGLWRQELEQKGGRDTASWHAPHGLLSLLQHSGPPAQGWHAYNEQCPPT